MRSDVLIVDRHDSSITHPLCRVTITIDDSSNNGMIFLNFFKPILFDHDHFNEVLWVFFLFDGSLEIV